MGFWLFNRKTEEEDPVSPTPERLASDEFLSAYEEIAKIYEARAKQARESCLNRARELSVKDYFNYHELEEQYIDQIRSNVLLALRYEGLASEVRSWARDYRELGRRPPYMPPLPVDPNAPKPDQDGS